MNELDLKILHKKILECRICREKFGFEPRPYVWGEADAKIFQISQAPSYSVHLTGKPFNDKSGEILVKQWYKIDFEQFYNPKNFYISSISHCYPGKDQQGNDRRPPLICAKKWLLKELQLVKNQIYILVGSYAAKFFFPNKNLTQLVYSQNLTINDKPTFVIPHPSPSNFRWFEKHQDFFEKILPNLRKTIHKLIV